MLTGLPVDPPWEPLMDLVHDVRIIRVGEDKDVLTRQTQPKLQVVDVEVVRSTCYSPQFPYC